VNLIWNARGFLLLLGIGLLLTQNIKAQDNPSERMDKLISELDSIIKEKKSYITLPKPNTTLRDIEVLFNNERYDLDYEYPNVNMLEAERKSALQDWGLALETSYMENLEQGVFNSEGIFFKRRYRLGMEWDILNNGWKESQLNAKQLRREIKIEKIKRTEEVIDRRYEIMRENFLSLMSDEKNRLKNHYREVLKIKQKELKEMYDMGYKSWDEVLEISAEMAKTDMMLDEDKEQPGKKSSNIVLNSTITFPLPVLSLDFKKLAQAIVQDPNRELVNSLRLQNVKDQHRTWRDITLSANVRYNYFNQSDQQLQFEGIDNREYFSLGLNLSVPVSAFRNGSEIYEKALQNEIDYENNIRNSTRVNRLEAFFDEYQELKNKYAELYFKYLSQSEVIDRKGRKSSIENVEYSPSELLDLYIVQLETMWELKNAKEELYLKLFQISRLAPDLPLSAYGEIWQPPSLLKEGDLASHLYMWSDTFVEFNNDYLINYLVSRDFQTVLLSPGKPDGKKSDKVSDFIRDAKSKGIDVQLMKGSNVIMREENHESIKAFAETAEQYGASGIHLDVEPHTLDDWENQREKYLSQYIKMVEYGREVSNTSGLELSLSIPVFYDAVLDKISSLADKIYVMAYGSDEAFQISKRLSDEFNLDTASGCNSQLIVSLRPLDFVSNTAMNDFKKELDSLSGKNCYAIHDLNELLELN